MIYKDEKAIYDTDKDVWPRIDDNGCVSRCINCGCGWVYHHGWACPDGYSKDPQRRVLFSQLTQDLRYLTQSMLDSLGAPPTIPAPPTLRSIPVAAKLKEEKSDKDGWRFFRNAAPGECPCGGTIGVCPYHPR